MKILYIGSERSDAQAIATALRVMDEVVSVSWASRLEQVATWLDQNRDLAALIVDHDRERWASTMTQVRALAWRPPIVAIVPDGFAPDPDIHFRIQKNQSLFRDLPVVVTRAIERAAQVDLRQQLARAAAALQEAEQRHQSAVAAADRQLAEIQSHYEIGMARAAASWEMVDEQLRTAALEVERARQDQAAAAADVERLARQLAEADAAVEAARARTEHERLGAAGQLADRQREFESQISHEVDRRRNLEELLEEAVGALDDAEKRHASEMSSASAQSRELEATLRGARQDLESRAADIERLATREEEIKTRLVDVTDSRTELERRLAATEAAFDEAVARATRDRLAASKKAAEREAELDGQLRRESATRAALEQTVADRETALRNAQHKYDAALAAAATDLAERQADFDRERTQTVADRETAVRNAQQQYDAALAAAAADLAVRQADFDRERTQTLADRDRLAQQLNDAAAALEQARCDHQTAAADVQRLTEREAELQQAVSDGRTALLAAQQTHDAALAAAAADLAERQADFDRERTQTVADRDRLAQELSDIHAALEQARRDHQTAAADVQRLTEREADLASQLADVHADRSTLQGHLGEATQALRDGAARESELNERIQQELANRTALEQAVADGGMALRDAQQRHDSALAAAAADLAERQADFDRERTKTVADRDRLAQQLNDAATALKQARRDHRAAAADVKRLTEREADLASQLADVHADRSSLKRELDESTTAIQEAAAREAELQRTVANREAALRDAQQQHDAAMAAAAADLAERQADFDRERTQTVADRDRLAQQLNDAAAALEQARCDHQAAAADVQRLTEHEAELQQAVADGRTALLEAQQTHHAALTAAAAELTEHQARFDRELANTAAQRDRLADQLSETQVSLDQIRRERESAAADVERLTQREANLTSQLADAGAAHRETQQQHEAALTAAAADFAERQAGFDRELSEFAHDRARLVQRLRETTGDLEDVCRAYEASTADIERLTGREADLTSQLADAEAAAREAQERHDAALAAAATEFAEHQARLDRELSLTAAERDTLQQSLTEMQEQVQQMQEALTSSVEAFEASRADSHRLFEHAGLPMFRCTQDGTLIDANRACTTLIGRRTLDELQAARFPAAAFDAPNALYWLIERCLSTRVKETVESTWRRHDGGRLFVRLSARLSGPDVIEFVAEDLTRLRILEERLSQAHRMEAVGRLASEIAVTCGTLLNDIHHNGREWLTTTAVAADSRQRGERLLDDIGRAASLMEELAACGGEQQARTPMLVDLNTLIRDLEPVLKRVAGDEVDVQLQDDSSPLNVDVGTERVERLLVNLASYGRERMPFGGRLRIELGRSVVDRRFAAKHPNVRLGLHALITVTEIRRTGTDRPPRPRGPRQGVDFGTLQGLVSECGGHLWMKIQPPGEMVAKIHLPLSIPREQAPPRTRVARIGLERLPARWFQS